MSDILGKIGSAFATFFVALVLNKFLSTFRRRQLYLAYENILEYTTKSIRGYTVMLTVTNKGKEKEKNVTITLPKNKNISIISSNTVSYECEDDRITIDRVLPKELITFFLLVKRGDKLSKSNLPIIKSEDANGYCFKSVNDFPPSLGPAFFVISLTIAFIIIFAVSIYKGYDPIETTYTQYFKIKFANFYERGFENNSFSANSLTKKYSTEKNEFPIYLKSVDIKGDRLEYIFDVYNKTNKTLTDLDPPSPDSFCILS